MSLRSTWNMFCGHFYNFSWPLTSFSLSWGLWNTSNIAIKTKWKIIFNLHKVEKHLLPHLLTLSGKTQSLPSTSEKLFPLFFFLSLSFFALLDSVCRCLQGGRPGDGGFKTCLPSLKLRSTTVIVDAWYAQLVVYYCQQQVWTNLTSLALSCLASFCLPPLVGVAPFFSSKSKAAKQTFAAVQEAHTAPAAATHTANTIRHNKT